MIRVLVVDDEPLVREDILFLLQHGGYEAQALEAADGAEALCLLEREPVDVVLLDICMPNMDGLALLKHIRAGYAGIPVMIISGWDNFSYAQQALRDGAVDYLLKPIDLVAFGEAMGRVAGRVRAGREAAGGHDRLEYDRLRVERLVNQCLLGISARQDGNDEPDPQAMAVALCYGQGSHAQDETVFSVSTVLAKHAGREFEGAGARCHVVPYYGAANELLLVVCGQCPDALPRLQHALEGALEELAQQGRHAVCAAAGEVAGCDGRPMAHTHEGLLDTLMQRFAGRNGLIEPKPYPADAGSQRRAHMRAALALQASASGLDREGARAMFASFFSASFFAVMTAAQAQAAFAAVEGAMLDACFPARDAAGSPRAGDRSLQRFRSLTEVAEYLASFLPPQHVQQADIAALMKDARAYVHGSYLHPLTLHMLADRFHINPNYLSCMYKEVNGINFLEDLTDLRVHHAMRLLASGPVSISKVAELSGFSSQAYFQKVFKKQTGETPNEYRLNKVKSTSVDR